MGAREVAPPDFLLLPLQQVNGCFRAHSIQSQIAPKGPLGNGESRAGSDKCTKMGAFWRIFSKLPGIFQALFRLEPPSLVPQLERVPPE